MDMDFPSVMKIIESLGTVGVLAIGLFYLWKDRSQIVRRLQSLEDYQRNKMEAMVTDNAVSNLKLAEALKELVVELKDRPCATSAYHEDRGGNGR